MDFGEYEGWAEDWEYVGEAGLKTSTFGGLWEVTTEARQEIKTRNNARGKRARLYLPRSKIFGTVQQPS